MKTSLVEMETGAHIRDWVDISTRCDSTAVTCDSLVIDCADGADRFHRTLDPGMVYVTKVLQDGVALTQVDPVNFVATVGSWYLDHATRQLHVHSADGATPSAATFVAIDVLTLTRGRTIIKPIGSTFSVLPLTWSGRVTGLPSLSQRTTSNEPGAALVATLGEVTLSNEDGYFDRIFSERIVSGLELRILEAEETAAYQAFEVVRRAIMQEPVADAARARVPLLSLAAKLARPAIEDEFTTTLYPDMDPDITGFNMPIVLGSGVGFEAFRIGFGRWKVSSQPMMSLATVKKADGTTVATTTVDLALGEFTVSSSLDTEPRLYVDGRGVDLDYPGAWISWVVQNFGARLTSADINSAALAVLDEARPVKWGHQARAGIDGSGESVQDVLDNISRSAFVDWLVDGRTNVLSARARRRDQGNYLDAETSTLEGGLGQWAAASGATVSQTTTYRFRGEAALEIVQPASSPLAHARVAGLDLEANTLYVGTALVFPTSGATSTARLALADGSGLEYFSENHVLSATRWTRVNLITKVPITTGVLFCDSLAVTCDSTTVTCASEAGELRAYPQYNGGAAVTIVLDDAELVEAVVLDDTNADVVSITPVDPMLNLVRAGYQFDGRTQERRFVSREDPTVRPGTTESRRVQGNLVDATDAAIVAEAALDYYTSGRMVVALRVFDLSLAPQLAVGGDTVIYLDTTRRPSVPGDGRLFRVTSITEERPEDGAPELRLEAEALYDPLFDQMTVTAD